MKKAFTLVELMIVVAILGIVAAIIVPKFQGHSQQAKESAAKENLRILRTTILRYAIDNNDTPPGYLNNDTTQTPADLVLRLQLTSTTSNYLSAMPKNPFNSLNVVMVLSDATAFPDEPLMTDIYGWIYKPATRTIKLNWPGTDSTGNTYYDY